ncbi:MAG: phosphoenolpyruvate carboxykinase (ATP) [Chitinophagaceae bacterium]
MRQEILKQLGLERVLKMHHNLPVAQLVVATIKKNQGVLTDSGALACDTGKFTGRSPKDKYVVADNNTQNTIWWGEVNHPLSTEAFNGIYHKLLTYLSDQEIYLKDVYACSASEYSLSVRVVTEYPWQSLFAHNLFLLPTSAELAAFMPDWTILCASGFEADPEQDGTRAKNFTIINFTKKIILIGGTAYTGEIKKSVFTVLNYILAAEKKVLPMHCSANIGAGGDTAIFFGLSGTGKTTLSADPERKLIGDDEHGWDDTSVFNFEGGCYAKCANLSAEKEPQIFGAIRFGTLLENTSFFPGTSEVDYTNIRKTENTRAAYPLHFIENIAVPPVGKVPENIFFLTADAFGVLPPISKLTVGQAMYHFISGYTAKVAGTETGITEPLTTFSACFGQPFLPLHPTQYASLLGEKLKARDINVWLVNTGWTGGSYGEGERIPLKYTRAMIRAALNGRLNQVHYHDQPLFGLKIPMACPGIPAEILDPENAWKDKASYQLTAEKLANAFRNNFSRYREFANDEIIQGGPVV